MATSRGRGRVRVRVRVDPKQKVWSETGVATGVNLALAGYRRRSITQRRSILCIKINMNQPNKIDRYRRTVPDLQLYYSRDELTSTIAPALALALLLLLLLLGHEML